VVAAAAAAAGMGVRFMMMKCWAVEICFSIFSHLRRGLQKVFLSFFCCCSSHLPVILFKREMVIDHPTGPDRISNNPFTVRQYYLDNFPGRQNGLKKWNWPVFTCSFHLPGSDKALCYWFFRIYNIAIVYFIQPPEVFFRQFALSPAIMPM